MSRAAEDDVAKQASGQNQTFNENAQTAFTNTQGSIDQQQGDIGAYHDQLSKFAAANPYGSDGAYQTDTNKVTAGTADAASEAARQAAQGAAVRGGLNADAGVAAGQATDQANTRALMETQAKTNADRISQGADYGAKVLSASQVPATLQGAITGEQGKLAATEGGLSAEDLGTEQKADDQPNFGDTLGSKFADALGTFAGGGNVRINYNR